MKYKPSRNFIVSASLLIVSFFIMQAIVVPSITKIEMQAAALKSAQARPALISGIFRKTSWEEFDEKAKTIRETNVSYYIEKSDGATTKLNPKGSIDESLIDQYVSYDPLTRNITLDSKGGNAIQKKGGVSIFGSGSGVRPERPAHKKVLVLLTKFSNSTETDMTADQYDERLFGPNGYVRKFYAEMTHNKVIFDADVKGWYSLTQPGTNYPVPGQVGTSCYLTPNIIHHILDFYQLDLSNYDMVITVGDCEEYGTLGGTMYGSGELGIPLIRILGHYDRLDVPHESDYLDWPGLVWNMVHEIGHSFPPILRHSRSLDCNLRTIWHDCTVVDYGDPFDAMGNWSGRYFNFIQQKTAGWIGDENILIIEQSGDYHLDNLQTADGVVGAIINFQGTPLFAVEHRKPEGFDSYLENEAFNKITNGLILYSFDKYFDRWEIVDPNPTVETIYEDLRHDGIYSYQPFLDSNFGVSIDVTNITEEGVDFSVNYDYQNSDCGELASSLPSLSEIISPSLLSSDYIFYGSNQAATLKLKIDASYYPQNLIPICDFQTKHYQVMLLGSTIPDWVPNPEEHTFNVNANVPYSDEFSFGQIASTIIPGTYNLTFKISDLDTGEQQTYDFPVTVDSYDNACQNSINYLNNVDTTNLDGSVQIPYPGAITLSPGDHFYFNFYFEIPPSPKCYITTNSAYYWGIYQGTDYGNVNPYSWDTPASFVPMFSGGSYVQTRAFIVPTGTLPGVYNFGIKVVLNGVFSPQVYNVLINVI